VLYLSYYQVVAFQIVLITYAKGYSSFIVYPTLPIIICTSDRSFKQPIAYLL